MKRNKYLFLAAAAILALSACKEYDADEKKFGNVVYLDVAATSGVQSAIIKNTIDETERSFSATLAYPSTEDVAVSIAVDPSLVATYNARYSTQLTMLDAKHYTLSTGSVTIPVGKTFSDAVTIGLHKLLGEDAEQTGALPLDETFLLPVKITQSSIPALRSSSTVYYLVKRSSNITVAVQLVADNWIGFPTLDKYGANSIPWNNLTAMTYEALIYVDDFLGSITGSGGQNVNVSISSVMGIEQYLLLRMGDVNFERQQLQFDGSGSGSDFGKFPESDASKRIEKGRWYHIACTYDQSTRIVRIYVDGQIQSEGKEMGITAPTESNKINLAMRALYDFYLQNPTEENKQKYGNWDDARQFFIGYSYDDYRPLNGKVAEVRVWSVARTPEEIWTNMYEVKNPEQDATLLGYWKCNEGEGNTVKDYSQYGNDGVAPNNLVWPDAIEIPKINETED